MFNLSNLIDKFYLDKHNDRDQKHFYVTDAGRCARSLFFKFKNAPKADMEPHILRLFDHGDHMHQLIMKPLFGMRDVHVVASEVNIPPQEIISGRADAILSDGKTMYVLDIKSTNSMLFDKMTEPKEENVDQIQMYLHYLDVPKGILLYVNKNTLALKEYMVDYDKKRVLSLLKHLKDTKKKIDSDIVPDRIDSYPENWQCRYCQFKSLCVMANSGELPWADFKKKIELREKSVRNK
ncbi:MAG: PD-(D/E)XK nuclease family protein [Candidatus Nealsonbacteria bacterium]